MTGRKWIPWAVVALLLLSIGGVVVWDKIRGYRNRNPGNIRKGADQWQGLAPASDQTDPAFWRFTDVKFGIRALAKILKTYRANYEADTITEVISRWAPPTENDTPAYIAAVSASTGIAPGAALVYPRDLDPLVRAIIRHELGVQPYSDATISEGVSLA